MPKNNRVLKQVTFILPEYDPSGDIREDIHMGVENELMEVFGNVEISMVETFYKDVDQGNEVIHDHSISYTVYLPSILSKVEQVQNIAVKFANELGQSYVVFKNTVGEINYLEV